MGEEEIAMGADLKSQSGISGMEFPEPGWPQKAQKGAKIQG